ncbi:aminotransferase class V-fold PLP-dependent enzyme [Halovulum dunhuangense]|uniref:Aminotransferase class V-fold PLP-dependent enzyme n=1 Tax=Halovulum dunhuangense TaxID=1505036 RepID=A0A849L191_9RHOB|nr:aminotransferase class V-fold PLP-dependent enzyme [Halovulum dunhuangense]
MALDLDFVRAQFPALAEPAYPDHAHFENAGGSYACGPVIDRLTRFYRETKVQPYGPAPATRRAGEEMDEARSRLAAMLNVEEDLLSFGPSTTQNTYVLAQAFGEWMAPGDAIIVTNQDHEANTGPWRRLERRGIEVREWQVDPETGALDPAGLARLLDGRVRLVCLPHCSNILGRMNPVAEWCRMVHEAGAVACVDGVSAAPHGLPDVAALGADIYLFSSYKTYGPHQGIMTISRALAEALPNQGHYFNAGYLSKRFTPAGPDHAQIAACAGMADYIDALYARHFGAAAAPAERARAVAGLQRAQEEALLAPLLAYLRSRNDIRLLGPRDVAEKVGTVAIAANRPGAQLAEALAAQGIMAGGGDFYATRLITALGIAPEHGVLRMSFVHYTSRAEVDRLIAALDRVL